MKTQLHTYYYDLNTGGSVEYATLKAKLEHTPGRGHWMHAIRMSADFDPQPGEITLEPEHLFQNQWNSNVGRVFDWYEEAIFINSKEQTHIKRGHYLDITDEMREIRRNTLKCGYTGQQFPAAKGYVFNETQEALGSPYLQESELHLLRLLPVCEEWVTQRQPLTDAEREHLLPLYIEAQTRADASKRDKQRAEVLAEYEKDVATATAERDGFLWLLNHGVQTENCIYYSHTGRFGFGWRSPYTGKAREALLMAIAKFPFAYDVQ